MANQVKNPQAEQRTSASSGKSIFQLLEEGVTLEAHFDKYFSGKYLVRLVFCLALGLVYIFNSHLADKWTREDLRLKKELEGLRTEFVTLKQEYLQNSRRSEVAERVKDFGLEDNGKRVYRINLSE